jgi:hypothetical protein
MFKGVVLVLLILVPLIFWRASRVSRSVQSRRKEADDLPQPFAGILIAIVLLILAVVAFFVLPGLVDRLP